MNIGDIKRIVFFGECMVEHRANDTKSFGGDTLNTAWYLRQLIRRQTQQNMDIYYATAIGKEHASLQLLAMLANSGINSEFVQIHPSKQLGEYWVSLDEEGERHFRFNRQDSAARRYFALAQTLTEALIAGSIDAIYLSGISLAILSPVHRNDFIEALHKFKRHGGIIIFDNNYRAVLWQDTSPVPWYLALMALADVAFLTDEDEYAVFGTQSVDRIIALHSDNHDYKTPQLLVIRQGAKPCIVFNNQGKQQLSVASLKLEESQIIDTCAAGDAFAAGFLLGLFNHQSLRSCALFAHQIAATVISQHGALIDESLLPKALFQELWCEADK
ncbi:sugar kinase [Pseudoalteromonas sp. T1lg65]|uniref:sugar kinase n=1 Tax=Pseudoalteromonas sp. T1lg65 TaxID=2077101 RepID=UPI003F7AD080